VSTTPSDKEKESEKKPSPRNQSGFIKYTSIAGKMIVIIVAGAFGGLKLDEVLEMEKVPVFTLVGTLLAVSLAMYVVIKDISK
jgi:F0F1-type ATP synthase assembly protein I